MTSFYQFVLSDGKRNVIYHAAVSMESVIRTMEKVVIEKEHHYFKGTKDLKCFKENGFFLVHFHWVTKSFYLSVECYKFYAIENYKRFAVLSEFRCFLDFVIYYIPFVEYLGYER